MHQQSFLMPSLLCPRQEVASRGHSTSCPVPSPWPRGSTALVLHLFILEAKKGGKKKEIPENQVYSHQLLALQAAQGILVCLHPHLDPLGFKWTVKNHSQRDTETKLKISSLAEANEK